MKVSDLSLDKGIIYNELTIERSETISEKQIVTEQNQTDVIEFIGNNFFLLQSRDKDVSYIHRTKCGTRLGKINISNL
jgi:hypothetical protein